MLLYFKVLLAGSVYYFNFRFMYLFSFYFKEKLNFLFFFFFGNLLRVIKKHAFG